MSLIITSQIRQVPAAGQSRSMSCSRIRIAETTQFVRRPEEGRSQKPKEPNVLDYLGGSVVILGDWQIRNARWECGLQKILDKRCSRMVGSVIVVFFEERFIGVHPSSNMHQTRSGREIAHDRQCQSHADNFYAAAYVAYTAVGLPYELARDHFGRITDLGEALWQLTLNLCKHRQCSEEEARKFFGRLEVDYSNPHDEVKNSLIGIALQDLKLQTCCEHEDN